MVKTVTLLDELDHPNDLSVFYCENSHYYFIIFFKPFNFVKEFPVSPCKYYENQKYNIVVGLLHSPPGYP